MGFLPDFGGASTELALDLHIEGSRPVTLFVRDESHSTSGRQDTYNTASSTPKSNNGRSPIHSALPPHQPPLASGEDDDEDEAMSGLPVKEPLPPPPPHQPQPSSLAMQVVQQQQQEESGREVKIYPLRTY